MAIFDFIFNQGERIWTWIKHQARREGWDWVFAHVAVPLVILICIFSVLSFRPALAHENLVSAFLLESVIYADGEVTAGTEIALVLEPDHPPFTLLGSDAGAEAMAVDWVRSSLGPKIAASHISRFRFTRHGLEVDRSLLGEPFILITDLPPGGTITIGSREIDIAKLKPPSQLSQALLLGPAFAAFFGFGWICTRARETTDGLQHLGSDEATDEDEDNVVDGN